MTRQHGKWMAAVTLLVVLGASDISQAQELRPDVMSNGVRIGAGAGAAAGALVSLTTEEICSPGACAYIGGLTGGLIGLLIDRQNGDPRPIAPGSPIDDRLWNGMLIGAASGAGIVLLDAIRRCRPDPGRPPCTRNGILLDMSAAAQWVALVGLLIDAALPSRLQAPAGVAPERSQRRRGVSFNLRF